VDHPCARAFHVARALSVHGSPSHWPQAPPSFASPAPWSGCCRVTRFHCPRPRRLQDCRHHWRSPQHCRPLRSHSRRHRQKRKGPQLLEKESPSPSRQGWPLGRARLFASARRCARGTPRTCLGHPSKSGQWRSNARTPRPSLDLCEGLSTPCAPAQPQRSCS